MPRAYARRMRIVFFGSGEFGLPTLAALAGAHEVTGVVSQPDRPAGRGGAVTPTPIAAWAAANLPGVPLVRSERVSAGEDLARVRALPADAWVVIAFGQKLSAGLLEGKRAVNLHASLLPRWRGAAPINAAVMAGDAETGNSVITLAERMDAGLVLAQSRRAIEPSVTAGELHDLLSADGPALVLGVLADLDGAIARGAAQDESRATRAPKLSRSDAWVDWGRPAREVRARIHGFTPWPGVSVTIGGAGGGGTGERVKLLRVADQPQGGGGGGGGGAMEPGRLVDASTGLVACGEGSAVRILEVHPAGRNRMAWGEFARGRRLEAGARVESEVRAC